MELSFEFWYLFPIALAIATLAMASGIGGAVFFSPLFMLVLKLEPQIAIGSALITELFGFSSGLLAYLKAKLVDVNLAKNLLLFSLPAALLGSYYADLIAPSILKLIFAIGLVIIGVQLFKAWRKDQRDKKEPENEKKLSAGFESSLTDAKGRVYLYTVCNKNLGRSFAAIGGVFVGMISVGLAELQEYHLVARCKVPTPVAVATSIFVVVITVLAASVGHIYEFTLEGSDSIIQVLNVVIFTAPGVVLGGQIGPKLQSKLPEEKIKIGISILFIFIGLFMLYTVFK